MRPGTHRRGLARLTGVRITCETLLLTVRRPLSSFLAFTPPRLAPKMFALTVPLLLLAASTQSASASAFYWPNVKHVFSFGDSYTDTYARFVNGTLTASQDGKVRRCTPTAP